jgi:hypothetical protein
MVAISVTAAVAAALSATALERPAFGQSPTQPAASACAPVNGMSFICGLGRPEDLKLLPGGRWVIASGQADGAGLKLINAQTKIARRWWSGAPAEVRPDRARYGACPGAPAAGRLTPHGLALRPLGEGRHTLYVVNHGGRETIEVFEVDARGSEPAAVWIGCVPMPPGLAGNGVAAFADGTILTTVQILPGRTLAQQITGQPTGGVYQWAPGDSGFRLLPGTSVPGNNGIETSPDGREFYVVGVGARAVFVYDRADPGKGPVRKADAPGFMPDNIAWAAAPDGGPARLVTTGMFHDEPSCGGPRTVTGKNFYTCPRGYVVAALDPNSMAWTILDYGEPNPAFNGVAGSLFVGEEVWLSSFLADRLAWRPLPSLRNAPPR